MTATLSTVNPVETQRERDRMLDPRELVRCQDCDAMVHYGAAEIIMWYREPVLIRCHPCADKRWADMMEERRGTCNHER